MNKLNATLNFAPSAVAGVSGFISESEIIDAHKAIRGYSRDKDVAAIVIGFGCDDVGAFLPVPLDTYGREYFHM